MRLRVVSAILMLAWAGATVTLARQPSGVLQVGQPANKANLRSHVVKLIAELELIQLEHEADRVYLLGLIKAMQEYEAKSSEQVIDAAKNSLFAFTDMEFQKREQVREEAFQKKLDAARSEQIDAVFAEREAENRRDIQNIIKRRVDTAKTQIDRKKKDYARQAGEIASKRLELADVEKRYNDTR